MKNNKKIINTIYNFIPNDEGYLLFLKEKNNYKLLEKDVTDWFIILQKAKFTSKFIILFKKKLLSSNNKVTIMNNYIRYKTGRFTVDYIVKN